MIVLNYLLLFLIWFAAIFFTFLFLLYIGMTLYRAFEATYPIGDGIVFLIAWPFKWLFEKIFKNTNLFLQNNSLYLCFIIHHSVS